MVKKLRDTNFKFDIKNNVIDSMTLKHQLVTHGKNRYKYVVKNVNIQHKHQGIIFVWPQRKKCHTNKDMTILMWFFAHCLYCLHILNLWPSGTAIYLNKPAWEYKTPLLKPETHDYIIEPDWDSINF